MPVAAVESFGVWRPSFETGSRLFAGAAERRRLCFWPRRTKPTNYTTAAPATAADVKDDLLRLMRSNFSWGEQADVWYRWGYEQSPYPSNVCWLVETEARE